jgi:hypothetical protein
MQLESTPEPIVMFAAAGEAKSIAAKIAPFIKDPSLQYTTDTAPALA